MNWFLAKHWNGRQSDSFEAIMQKARSPIMATLALLALCASMVPALSWACPLTGQIGDATTVCKPMEQGAATKQAQPCTHLGGKCCKRIPLPDSPESGNKKNPSTTIGIAAADGFVALPHFTSFKHAVALLPETPAVIFPSGNLFRPTSSPPSSLSQRRPAALAGRAPPTF